MQKFFHTSAMALTLAAAPAVAQTAAPPATGQNAMNQQMMNPNAMGQTTLDQNSGGATAPVPSDQMTPSGQNSTGTGSMGSTGTADQSSATRASDGPSSPDGSPAFGIEPYFGIMGGYHSYDRLSPSPGVNAPRFDGALVEGLLGVNIPLGPLFVGAEGHVAYGFGDARWEYGVRGRGGARIGDSGLIYASAGYMWTDVRNGRGFADRESWIWGIGLEAGPRDIGLGGITSNSGLRFRISMETADFDSIRPMAGVIVHF